MKRLLLALLLSASPWLPAEESNRLSGEEREQGWVLLFNGRDFEGWRKFGGDEKPGPGWKVEDGMLRRTGGGWTGDIVTEKVYGDFEFSWEWRISEKGNNGVKYLVDETRRSAPGPEYQMLDNEGHPDGRSGRKRITAALYDILPPAEDAPFKAPGEWNQSRIVVKGKRVEHWLNGRKVVEYELGSPDLKAAIAKSKFRNVAGFGDKAEGRIMLTDHQDSCDFRNLRLRPLRP